MEPLDRVTVVCDPGMGRLYDPTTGKEFFPRPPDPPPCPDPPQPREYDPAVVRAALYPDRSKEHRRRLDEDIPVIVTYVDPDTWSGNVCWRIARMRRRTYETLRDGGQINPSCVSFAGSPTPIDKGGCNASAWSPHVKKREKKEVQKVSKLLNLPYLLRLCEKSETRRWMQLESPKRD